jgi:hypothetical protein
MAFLPRETAHHDAAFIAAGESARGLGRKNNEPDETHRERVGRAAVDAYRSAVDPNADAKRLLNLLMPFAESAERNPTPLQPRKARWHGAAFACRSFCPKGE